MEGGVKTRDLRQLGHAFEQPTNGRQIVRLMEWRQWDQIFECRRRVASMTLQAVRSFTRLHDPVADADERYSASSVQEDDQVIE